VTILTDIFDGNFHVYGEYPLLYFEDESYSNHQLYRRMCRIGNGLRAAGMQPGDLLLIHMENVPDIVNLYIACAKTGIIFCPTMFLISAEELSWIAENSGAKYVVTSPELLPKVRLACNDLVENGAVIVTGTERQPGALLLESLIEDQPDSLETLPDLGDEDLAGILFTSGTTGKPKGVMLSHKNIGSNIHSIAISNRITRDEVALSALPLSHSYGLTMALLPWLCGLNSILMRWFNAEAVFEATERYHVRTMTGIPGMYIQMLNHPRAWQYNVRSWKRLQTGAAPLPEEVLRAFRQKFSIYLYEGYGLTEASPVVSCQRPELEMKPGSVGPPLYGVEVKIRDDYERELPSGSPGEITVKGPNVMKGYLNDKEDTERALRGGWLHTGDVGYIDEEGYIFIVERKKDLIITDGFNLYPSEVEQVIERHPAVKEAAVIGEPDPVKGEVVHAFVVLERDREVSEDALIRFVRESLVYYKCPRTVTFIDELPKTFLGKPSHRELRTYLTNKP
jgi:long-chain acyl-CoA synthetase